MLSRATKAHRAILFVMLVACWMLATASVTRAQTFTQIPALAFTKPFGGANPLPQVITAVSTGANFNFTATATTTTGGAWLSISKSGVTCCTTPEVLTVTVNPDIALAVGTYQGQIALTSTSNGSLTIPVSLTVAATNSAYFDNATGAVTFSLLTGASIVPPQTIQIRNGGSGTLNWTASASTADGGGWLQASALSGTAPSSVTVSIELASLPGGGSTAGTFLGQLAFQTAGSSVTIPVSVTVGTSVFKQINPINFTMPFGGANPLPQVLSVISTGTNFNFDSVALTGKGAAWLTVSKSGVDCCTTPEAITVSVNASTLAAGTYTGELLFTQYSLHDLAIVVPVTLTIAASGTTYFDSEPGQMTFSMVPGALNVTPQSLTVRNGGTGTLNWTGSVSTADGGSWLSASALSGVAPATITISVNPVNLPGGGQIAGTFVGQLFFQTTGSSFTVPVSVSVGGTVFRQVNPISFTMPFGGANPLPQILSVISTGESSGSNFNFDSVAVTSKGGAWLTVSKSGVDCCTTPEVLTVSVNASTLAAGTYTGEIILTQYSIHDLAMMVPVTLTIAPTSSKYFDSMAGEISFSLLTGAPTVPAQTLQVRNGGTGSFSWTGSFSTSDGGDWLAATPLSGTTPTTVSVSITPSNLPGGGLIAGTFVGQLSFQTTGSSVTIPVAVTVGASVFRQINPISFTMPFGGANPLPQVISAISTGSNFNFDSVAVTSKGGAWLTVSKSGVDCCTTPEALTVSVNASTLAVGTYTGEITLTQYSIHDIAITIPVTLTIAATSSRYFDNMPGQVSFSLQTGATAVPSQTLQVRNGGTGSFTWTGSVSTADGGDWLVATPLSGSTPSTVSVSITPANLPGGGQIAGTFIGQLSFQTTGSTFTVPVSVSVGTTVFRQLNPISFTMPFGGANPLPQILPIISTGESSGSNFNFDSVAVNSKGGAWLTVSKSGVDCCTTPETLTVSVNASTLAAGTYTGEIILTQYSIHDLAMTVPVTLTITSSTAAYFDNIPGEASFSFKPSQSNPPAQTVMILNAGAGTLNWTASVSTADGGAWLTATPRSGIAPSTATIKVVTSKLPGQGLIAGTYVGQVLLQGKGNSVTIPVSVNVGDPVFVQLPALNFSTVAGISPNPQMITVSSTSTAFNFDGAAVSAKGGSWLTISPSGIDCCTTPKVITVTVNGTNLTPGTYIGQLNFTQYSVHDKESTVPVIVTVSGAPGTPEVSTSATQIPGEVAPEE
ncbi:MAG TPA: hypothetical protein VFA68_17345 [Terriglobales bacterium]|nr:hypothetical protein [Terriglobales bacterium]